MLSSGLVDQVDLIEAAFRGLQIEGRVKLLDDGVPPVEGEKNEIAGFIADTGVGVEVEQFLDFEHERLRE